MLPPQTLKGISCTVGGVLIQFSLGTIYTFGNMSPYITSYLRSRTSSTWVNSGHVVWVFSMAVFAQGIVMALGGEVEKKIGTRLTCLIGSWSMSLGTVCTYFALKSNLWSVIVTYGFIFGLGTGLTYSVAIAAPIKWFPKRKGLVSGIVVAGYGLGSLVFNFVQTQFINPENVPANGTEGGKYFDQEEVLDRIPICFVMLGSVYAAIQLVGALMMFNHDSQKSGDSGEVTKCLSFRKGNKKNGDTALVPTDEKVNQEDKTQVTYTNEVAEIDEEPQQRNFTVKEAVKDRHLWILCSIFFSNGFFIVTVASLYKSFGQNFIANDQYFAVVGSISAVCNACGRLSWGRLFDRFGFRIVMTALNICMIIFMSTFYTCGLVKDPIGIKVMYFIWVCCLFVCLAGSFAILPAATAQTFGSGNMATIYGFVFGGYAISSVLGALVSANLIKIIHYGGIFIIATVAAFISMIITQFYRIAHVPAETGAENLDKENLE